MEAEDNKEKRLIERWNPSLNRWVSVEMADLRGDEKVRFDGRDDMVFETHGEPYTVTNEHGEEVLGIVCEPV